MSTKIQFVQGDLTEQAVDAVVCDADTQLTMGEGAAADVLRKGGQGIREDCERLAPIPLGEAAVTTGGSLRAFYVLHAVVRRPHEPATLDTLRLAVHHALLKVEEKAFKSVACSALGTGAAGLAAAEAAEVVMEELLKHLRSRSSMEQLSFVLADEATRQAFEAAYQRLSGQGA